MSLAAATTARTIYVSARSSAANELQVWFVAEHVADLPLTTGGQPVGTSAGRTTEALKVYVTSRTIGASRRNDQETKAPTHP